MLIQHGGIYYSDFIAAIVKKRFVRTYLEIGVSHGVNLAKIECETAIGVDPHFDINVNIMSGKKSVHLFQCPSDEFFKEEKWRLFGPNKIDFAFLDGMHLFEYLLRDFYKSERICHRHSLIALHDCLPLNGEMTERIIDTAGRSEKELAHFWTGDVWKLVPILKKYRTDLIVTAVDCPPTGLVFISNLDPESDILERSYGQIVADYAKVSNDESAVTEFYREIEVIDSNRILDNFDHSLYFKV